MGRRAPRFCTSSAGRPSTNRNASSRGRLPPRRFRSILRLSWQCSRCRRSQLRKFGDYLLSSLTLLTQVRAQMFLNPVSPMELNNTQTTWVSHLRENTKLQLVKISRETLRNSRKEQRPMTLKEWKPVSS